MIRNQQHRARPQRRLLAHLCGSIAHLLLGAGTAAVANQDIGLEDAIRKFAPAENAANQEQTFPANIWQAIETAHLGAIEEYLGRGVNLSSHHPRHGRTPLSFAAATGNTSVLELLFDYGADPDVRNRDGSTPLHDAALMGESRAAALLIERGASPNLQTRRGETPLDTARLPWFQGRRRIRQLGLEVDRREREQGRAEVIELLGGRSRRSAQRLVIALAVAAFTLLAGLLVLFHLATCCGLSWALYRVPSEHRQVTFWQVWLLSVPCLAVVAHFFVLPRLSRSYANAYGGRAKELALQVSQLGVWFSVIYLGVWIPVVNGPAFLASLVLLLVYCVKLEKLRSVGGLPQLPRNHDSGTRSTLATIRSAAVRPVADNRLATSRRYDLDALRGVAMLLGIGLHSAMPFGVGTWPIQDPQQHDGFRWFFCAVHGFRMPLFFLLSGYFTCMLWQRRGLRTMLWQRFSRVAIPLVVGTLVIVPVMNIASVAAVIGTTALSLRMEAEQELASTPAGAGREVVAATRDHVPGLIDFDGLVSTYGLVGFVLFYVPVFQHLWFLWFLCWLVALFAAFAAAAEKWDWKAPPGWLISGPLRYLWIIPVTLLFQSMMVLRLPWFGPDTSTGILPAPHVLGYFGVFFAFGALYFASDDQRGRMGSWWWLHLAVGWLVVLPCGMTWPGLPVSIGLLFQVVYSWSISFGMLGLFRKCFRQKNRVVRYLSDASYWLYLTHIPLVVLCQWWVYTWNIPALIKFLTVAGVPTVVLLVVYHLVVRHTWIGTALNGSRTRSAQLPSAAQKQG